MSKFDLVIRGGTLFDGLGGPGREADVAVSAGMIAEVGKISGSGREEIDAKGKIVTPGFVDIHTHYDGQVTWDERLTPSSWHGVTTAVMGNCGVGFAPCRMEDRERLMRLMEGVEDIPEPVLAEGLPWNWETFPEFLDAIGARRHDIDFATQLPHGALRVYVMGERGANREPATPADIAAMAALAGDAIKAGALGFSTSRTINHRSSDGKDSPSFAAAAAELVGISLGLKDAGGGVIQVISDFGEPKAEFAMLEEMMTKSGCPLSLSLIQNEFAPEGWRKMFGKISKWSKMGLTARAQVFGRPIGALLGLELTFNPLSGRPSYEAIKHLPLPERVAILKQPEFRAKVLAEEPVTQNPFLAKILRRYNMIFPLSDPPNYEPLPETSIGAIAERKGVSTQEIAYDLMLERDGRALLYCPVSNYTYGTLDPIREMITDEGAVLGLADGGAHVGMICDSSYPTTMLAFWTRDRVRGEKLPLEWVIAAQTRKTAEAIGLLDRGLVAQGYKADLNVIDYDRLSLHAPHVVYDLPGGGRRLVQEAEGYEATIVSGETVYRDGVPTGALPGKLIRGATVAGK